MPTEAGKAQARALVRKGMGGQSYSAFAESAGVDPQTLGDFIAGRRWPIRATLSKIEAALKLTPGTLAAIGEDPGNEPAPASEPSELTDAELLTELGYRMKALQRENDELKARLNEALASSAEASTDPDLQPPADGGLADLARHRAQVEGNPYLQRQAARRGGPKQGEDPGIDADFNQDPQE